MHKLGIVMGTGLAVVVATFVARAQLPEVTETALAELGPRSDSRP